ncbi:triose-phosphate isomerase [candidate division KSB1 bacterium]|nr:triose-phosphate isomerase [candidate division KSB1 bacterium]
MRKRIIAGNWKMNKTVDEALELAAAIKEGIKTGDKIDVVLCPPFTDVTAVALVIQNTRIGLGGQNLHWEEKGAFTGEISAAMLRSAGCEYVIIGHSERRQYFHETDETVNRKIKTALSAGLRPIVCVGETLKEREDNLTERVLETQVEGCLAGLTAGQAAEIILAYEPVWAIGTGVVATVEQAQAAHQYIRDLLFKLYDRTVADRVRIQYGGSMKPDNSGQLLAQPDIDGGLVGGASLDAQSFLDIIHS